MAELVLGPMLRHVGEHDATVWVETDAECEVEVLGSAAPTFCVAGHHYALVCIDGLEPRSRTPYEVKLDGEVRWPEAGASCPPRSSTPSTRSGRFGSSTGRAGSRCLTSRPTPSTRTTT